MRLLLTPGKEATRAGPPQPQRRRRANPRRLKCYLAPGRHRQCRRHTNDTTTPTIHHAPHRGALCGRAMHCPTTARPSKELRDHRRCFSVVMFSGASALLHLLQPPPPWHWELSSKGLMLGCAWFSRCGTCCIAGVASGLGAVLPFSCLGWPGASVVAVGAAPCLLHSFPCVRVQSHATCGVALLGLLGAVLFPPLLCALGAPCCCWQPWALLV